jgi:aspartate aminotransferase
VVGGDGAELALDRLNAIDGLPCIRPPGAFYLYPNCAGVIGRTTPEGKTIETDLDFVLYLLESVGVASIHGGAYGLEPHFRISTATSMEVLEEGCARIETACEALG